MIIFDLIDLGMVLESIAFWDQLFFNAGISSFEFRAFLLSKSILKSLVSVHEDLEAFSYGDDYTTVY